MPVVKIKQSFVFINMIVKIKQFLMVIKDGAYKYRSIFVRFMTMQEKQILIAWPIEIQKENWGNHAFFREN